MRKRPENLHDKLVDRAARWLKYKQRCRPIFAEMATAAGSAPDAIGWFYGASRLVEVKVSRSDFFRDRTKLSFIHPGYAMGRKRWYLTPPELIRPEDLPEGWGLLWAEGTAIREVVEAPERLLEPTTQEQEMLMLSSAIRRLILGSRYSEASGRWEAVRDSIDRKKKEARARQVTLPFAEVVPEDNGDEG